MLSLFNIFFLAEISITKEKLIFRDLQVRFIDQDFFVFDRVYPNFTETIKFLVI